jgi:hypothetical protein
MRPPLASTSRSLRGVMARFQVSINGRFWVSTEGSATDHRGNRAEACALNKTPFRESKTQIFPRVVGLRFHDSVDTGVD